MGGENAEEKALSVAGLVGLNISAITMKSSVELLQETKYRLTI
jgi:hypothetical protein